jgi:hypothetical protein
MSSAKQKLIIDDGIVYEGDVVNGKPHGTGKMTFADGSVEEGKWKGGKFVGK